MIKLKEVLYQFFPIFETENLQFDSDEHFLKMYKEKTGKDRLLHNTEINPYNSFITYFIGITTKKMP